MLPYVDSKKLGNRNYKLNKKPDIFSVGVIMWQISSGHQPFENVEYDVNLILAIQLYKAEKEKKLLMALPLNIVTYIQVSCINNN